MANEIKIQATLQVLNGSIDSRMLKDFNFDQAYAGCWVGEQDIGYTAESLYLSGVMLARAIYIENLDSYNAVDIGPTSGGTMIPMIRLHPGEMCVMPLFPGTSLKAKCADAVALTGGTDSSCTIVYMVVET